MCLPHTVSKQNITSYTATSIRSRNLKMRRAQIVEPQKPLVISETTIPEPPAKGLVVKTLYSGICHSDVNQWFNEINHGDAIVRFTDNPNYKFPIVPGHEIAGVVHSLGPETKHLKIGDRVAIYAWTSCGDCGFCDNDCTPLCNRRYFSHGIGGPGGYSTYVLVRNEKYALKVPNSLPMEIACMLSCSALTTYNAVLAMKDDVELMSKYKGRASVLLIGLGGLGLWCLQIAKNLLPAETKIVAADISKKNLEAAKERGCDDVVLWERNKPDQEMIKITKQKAIDGAFDAVIDVVNSTITAERGFKCSHRGSTLVMVGLYGGTMALSLPKMIHGMRTIKGVLTGTLKQFSDLIQLVATKKLSPPPITFFTLDDAYDGMCKVRDGEINGRGIIKF